MRALQGVASDCTTVESNTGLHNSNDILERVGIYKQWIHQQNFISLLDKDVIRWTYHRTGKRRHFNFHRVDTFQDKLSTYFLKNKIENGEHIIVATIDLPLYRRYASRLIRFGP